MMAQSMQTVMNKDDEVRDDECFSFSEGFLAFTSSTLVVFL
eukprot:CAMPEP_0118919324 /NCGR_PEP_ID=MMETSP1166-20130328/18494_1 /TAXON_ID=1104430 /ORGANISM="Chrysoreinhardia sp, Strain CCMP3193" /LENGTH=40 /DNA_ID= /DNA_START= /DNA_END= /DNA_ORIENTATION=